MPTPLLVRCDLVSVEATAFPHRPSTHVPDEVSDNERRYVDVARRDLVEGVEHEAVPEQDHGPRHRPVSEHERGASGASGVNKGIHAHLMH